MKTIKAPCLLENESITLLEAIDKMNKHGSNYLLLKGETGSVSGIFTERDLLKNLSEFVENTSWNESISKFMNTQVKSLPIGLMQTAPEFMRRHKLRHVPVTMVNAKTNKNEVVGIVTPETVLDYMNHQRDLPPVFGGQTLVKKRKTIGIASPDGSLWQLLHKVYSNSYFIDLERYKFVNLQTSVNLKRVCSDKDALIMDIDDAPNRFWTPAVRYFAENSGLDFFAIIYDESKHGDVRLVLEDFSKSDRFRVYKKPLDITKLTLDLEHFWSKKSS